MTSPSPSENLRAALSPVYTGRVRAEGDRTLDDVPSSSVWCTQVGLGQRGTVPWMTSPSPSENLKAALFSPVYTGRVRAERGGRTLDDIPVSQ